MTKRNRVDPFGELRAVPERGTLMGNRGNLHSAAGEIIRPYKRKQWVACLLKYRGRQRRIMEPGRYTELFFLDEATSLAAGHRPCGTCRREALESFRSCWSKSLAGLASDGDNLKGIDSILHSERINRSFEQVKLSDLPDGVFVCSDPDEGTAYLWWRGKLHQWSPGGYVKASEGRGSRLFRLVTPASLVGVLNTGYPVSVHESANA